MSNTAQRGKSQQCHILTWSNSIFEKMHNAEYLVITILHVPDRCKNQIYLKAPSM